MSGEVVNQSVSQHIREVEPLGVYSDITAGGGQGIPSIYSRWWTGDTFHL